jgi:ribosome assembly protein 1
LFSELHLSPLEAYQAITRVLEQVNQVTGTLFSADYFRNINRSYQQQQQQHTEANSDEVVESDINQEFGEEEHEQSGNLECSALVLPPTHRYCVGYYFSPERGNVAFASSIDGWAFRTEDFAAMYAQKLGVKKEVLQKTLWGDFYFNPKTKKIHKSNVTGKLQPMFVQFVLNNIWEVYNATYK